MSCRVPAFLPAALCIVLTFAMISFLQISPAQAESGKQQQRSGKGSENGLSGYQEAERNPDQQEMKKNVAQMQERAQQLQQEIAEIRNKAMDKNPGLEDLLKELVLTRDEIMSENLAREDVEMKRLEAIDKKLKNKDSSPEKKNKLQQEKKNIYRAYKKAEYRTENNKKVRELREKFYTELMEAAKKEDPKAEEMLNELNRLRHQLNFARPEALPEEASPDGQ